MTALSTERLRSVSDLGSLLEYLGSELDWPVAGLGFDDVAFEYTAAEVGLDERLAIKVERIRRLRPFTATQPWGVFFLEFAPGKLAVTALRRILRNFVSKARVSGEQSWEVNNLLFISAAGDVGAREISFGHFDGTAPESAKLSIFGWARDQLGYRTLVEFSLPRLRYPGDPSDTQAWLAEWGSAFDVEAVTQRFFDECKTAFLQAEELIQGVRGDRRLFSQRLLNRLLFLQFVAKKGWLRFNGRTDYLQALFEDSVANGQNFYKDRLYPAMFRGLGTPPGALSPDERTWLQSQCGDLPYLGGGLFEPSGADEQPDAVAVPNEVFELVIRRLFTHYNFTVSESTPLDIEVAVDPEMLGKVFEKLVTQSERQSAGSYYTPRPVVAFMCREALKLHLGNGLEALVDEHDAGSINVPQARELIKRLESIKVVDPACGSGAYLLGMLHELHSLTSILDTRAASPDPKDDYHRKLSIIENNLYGVDIQEFAVNIARLRLWLSLAVDFGGETPEPLPSLEFKIGAGDSLTAPDPRGGIQPDMFRARQVDTIDALRRNLADPYWPGDRAALRHEISELRTEIAEWIHSGMEVPGFDWRVEFSDVFLGPSAGFDVVLANPPYVSALEFSRSYSADARRVLQSLYRSARGAFDLYVPFFERALQLLRPGGVLSFITPNKYLSASYANALRGLIEETTTFVQLVDLSQTPVFAEASVYPVLTLLRAEASPHYVLGVRLPSVGHDASNLETWPSAAIDSSMLSLLPDHIWGFLLSDELPLLRKIIAGGEQLQCVGKINATTTAAEADEFGVHLSNAATAGAFPVINTGTIDPYVSLWGSKQMTNGGERYLTPYLPTGFLPERRRAMYSAPKIIFAKMARRCEAFWDASGEYASLNTNCFYGPDSRISMEYVLAFCNSAIFHFLYGQFFGALRMAGGYFQFQAPQLRVIPIRLPSGTVQEPFVRSVRLIVARLAEGTSPDAEEIEKLRADIDDGFFRLYDLTPAEISTLRGLAR